MSVLRSGIAAVSDCLQTAAHPNEMRRMAAAWIAAETVNRLVAVVPLDAVNGTGRYIPRNGKLFPSIQIFEHRTHSLAIGSPSSVFVRALIDSRFQFLFTRGELPSKPSKSLTAGQVFCPNHLMASPTRTTFLRSCAPLLEEAVAGIIRGFLSPHMAPGSRETWLSNFLETVSLWATDAEFAGAFLSECLS